ncbi:MAG TPA: hypothetical protein VI197_20710, partial [Polyangiaceae bacterium]
TRNVLTRSGRWVTPQLVALIDDRSRRCCHAQWYLDESAQTLTHGSTQAFQKCALPRRLMGDGGSAMKAAEFREGLSDLGIEWSPTLAYSPEQNAKCEVRRARGWQLPRPHEPRLGSARRCCSA